MPKLPIVSSKQIIRILQRIGFQNAPKRGKGSHLALLKTDEIKTRLVIVPDRNEIPRGTLLAILEQAGLTKDEFIRMLND
jgi:predicted RNA binding protein YcfA (HicA-like mRNA interferase family)